MATEENANESKRRYNSSHVKNIVCREDTTYISPTYSYCTEISMIIIYNILFIQRENWSGDCSIDMQYYFYGKSTPLEIISAAILYVTPFLIND